MNGMNGAPGPAGLWQEARNADGRVYYYNTQIKVTQWEKPVDLMVGSERALANQPWKEYTAEGGKKYWYNTETKASSWDMPQVYKDALAQDLPPARPPAQAPTYVAGGGSSFPPYQPPNQQFSRDDTNGQGRPGGFGGPDLNGSRVFVPSSQSTEPEYPTFEEAEAAFLKLLRRSGVQPDWSWEEAMRAVIKDPQYRAIKDPKDRKSAFEKYVVEMRMQEKDRAKERSAKLRADFGTMLKSHSEIKHYTRWKTARPIIERETIFRSTDDETERRQLFDEYITDLKVAQFQHEKDARQSALDDLSTILNSLNFEPYTRWAEARAKIESTEYFQKEKKFRFLNNSDILGAFESHIKALERSFNDARQQQKVVKSRQERQNRDGFSQLLEELRANGKIKAGTKWKQVYPLLSGDQRYQALLGQPGSSPLELFRDVVEEEERGLRAWKNDILDALDDKRFQVSAKTTFEEFMAVIHNDSRASRIDKDILALIFDRIREKAVRRTTDAKHDQERSQKHAVDALRSKIKHLHPAVTSSSTWESVQPQIETSPEYLALPTDDLRRAAFDKVIRRLKEKEEDTDRDRTRHRHRDRDRRTRSPPDPYHRPRDPADRDYPPAAGSPTSSSRRGAGPRATRHRTPEPDAYEADRKKAQAMRERQYRKSSLTSAGGGLSPPRPARGSVVGDRDRDRDHRERSRERDHAHHSHHHGRRHDDDDGGGRGYRNSRGGTRDELDYGDLRMGVSDRERERERDKRRRGRSGSEGSTGRDSKRSRRGDRSERERDRRRRTPSPVAQRLTVPVKEEVLHSGSEEGEIEEE